MNTTHTASPPLAANMDVAHPIGVLWNVHPDLLCTMDMTGSFQSTNPAWQTLLGWSEAEVKARPLWDFIHPDDVQRTKDETAVIFQGQPTVRFTNRWPHKNGGYRWISWVALSENGVMFCSGRDVTIEREQAAQLSARTAERDRLWTLSQDMFARANLEGMMSAVSPGWTQVLGWSEEELLQRPYATFMHEEDMGPTLEALARMGETGQPTRFQNRISTSDGQWKWIEWTVAPELEGQNFVAVGRDISIVKARDVELAESQEALRQAQKMEAVGQLTGGLAHDFNNILAGITGSLDLIAKRLSQGRLSDVDQYVTAAQGAAKRAANLTNRLLAFSRRQTLIPAPARLSDLVDDMVELIKRSVGPHVEIITKADPQLWNTFADVGQVENALLNLCINARDAMPDGGRLEVIVENVQVAPAKATELGLKIGDYVALSVHDYGQGMPQDVIDRATEPFFTTKPTGQGTGLGLSMVYGFAGQSGGTMTIESEVGAGTTVCLYLPRYHGEAEVDADVDEPATVEAIQQKKTVLLVDDEVLVRMVVADDLSELGFNIIEAGDAATALKLVEPSQQIDLLLTDVGLPGGMNGRQLADAVLQMRPDLPVVFITGYAESSVLKNTDLGENMRVMTKPFQMDKLAELVGEVTGAVSAARA